MPTQRTKIWLGRGPAFTQAVIEGNGAARGGLAPADVAVRPEHRRTREALANARAGVEDVQVLERAREGREAEGARAEPQKQAHEERGIKAVAGGGSEQGGLVRVKIRDRVRVGLGLGLG